MTVSTTNLGLLTYDAATDGSTVFLTYRTDVAGSPTASNLQKIDNWAGETSGSIVSLQGRNQIVHIPGTRISGNYFLADPVSEVSAYATDMAMIFVPDANITGSATLQINALGIKDLKKLDETGNVTDLHTGDLRVQKEYLFRYDGTQWIWVNSTASDQINVTAGVGNNFVSINPSGSTLKDSGVPVVSSSAGNFNMFEVDAYGQVNSASSVIYKNILLNGEFEAFSRNPSPATGSPVENDNYCFDRWNFLSQTTTGSVLQVSGNTNNVKAIRLHQPQSSAQRMLIEQIIEYKDSVLFRERWMTFSGYVKTSATKTIRAALLNSGSTAADAVESDSVNSWTSTNPSTFFKTAFDVLGHATITSGSDSFTQFAIPAEIPIGTNNLMVAIWDQTTLSQDQTLDIVGCGLYPGKANPYPQPQSLQDEVYLNRYIRTIGNEVGDLYSGMVTGSANSTFVIPFETEMRIAPTAITALNVGQFNIVTASGSGVVSAITFNSATKKSLKIDVISGSHGESAGEICFLNCLGGSGLVFFETEL